MLASQKTCLAVVLNWSKMSFVGGEADPLLQVSTRREM